MVERALEIAGLMLGTDKSRGYCLEMICADFLVGLATSQDFDNWTTFEFGLGNCSLLPGFVQRALDETLTIIRFESTSAIN